MQSDGSSQANEAIVSGLLSIAQDYGLWALVIILLILGFFWRGDAIILSIGTAAKSVGTWWTEHQQMKRIQDREDKKLAMRIEASRKKPGRAKQTIGGSKR